MLHFPEGQTLGVFVESRHTDASCQGVVAFFAEKLTGSGSRVSDQMLMS